MERSNLCASCLNEHICVFNADDCPVTNCPWYREWESILRCDK